ncbi:MAG: hypothetical protein ABI024_01435 [Vicinamibacterales bacterium]
MPIGAIMPAATLWSLAQRWFEGRLAPDWKPRSVAQSQQLLEDAGFAGPFWQLKVEG